MNPFAWSGQPGRGVFGGGALAGLPQEIDRLGADFCVALGGGSTIGLGKAIALTSSLPMLAVPTTYAGSEMTAIFCPNDGGVKRTGRDPRVLPRAVGTRTRLRELGMPADGLDRAADLAVLNPNWNPLPLDRAAIRDLLQRACDGATP
jgi:alcohol dehydrogenase class IV